MTHPIDDLFRKEASKLHRMPPERVWRKLAARLDRRGAPAVRWAVAASLLALVVAAGFYALSRQRLQRPLAQVGSWEELATEPVATDRSPYRAWALYASEAPRRAQAYLESRRLLLRTEAVRSRVQVGEGGTIRAAAQLVGLWESEQAVLLLHQRGAAVMAWIVEAARLKPLFRIEGNLFVFEGTQPPLATRLQYDEQADGFVELGATWMGEVTLRFHPQANEWQLRCRRHTAWYDELSKQLGPGKLRGERAEWRFRKGSF